MEAVDWPRLSCRSSPFAGLAVSVCDLDAYFAGLHELWNGEEPPEPDDERALMGRFGMDTV